MNHDMDEETTHNDVKSMENNMKFLKQNSI